MRSIQFYLDEDSMNRSLLMVLRQREIDVTTVSEVKREGFSDEEQLLWATQNHRVICTDNIRDFSKLHKQFLAENQVHASRLFNWRKIIWTIRACRFVYSNRHDQSNDVFEQLPEK